jgi:hypothetical protein
VVFYHPNLSLKSKKYCYLAAFFAIFVMKRVKKGELMKRNNTLKWLLACILCIGFGSANAVKVFTITNKTKDTITIHANVASCLANTKSDLTLEPGNQADLRAEYPVGTTGTIDTDYCCVKSFTITNSRTGKSKEYVSDKKNIFGILCQEIKFDVFELNSGVLSVEEHW